MAAAARPMVPAALRSARTPRAASAWNVVEPSRQQTMKHEKTAPKGVAAPDPKTFATPLARAGGHCSTKMYMAPSKSACIAPTVRILRSPRTVATASRTEGPSPAAPASATFSFQRRPAASAPAARKPAESSKGPVGPRIAAAAAASCPARMATSASPA